jgi:hypothetical protein
MITAVCRIPGEAAFLGLKLKFKNFASQYCMVCKVVYSCHTSTISSDSESQEAGLPETVKKL